MPLSHTLSRRWRGTARLLAALAFTASLVGLSGCASQSIEQYAAERPALDLARYFNGKVLAHGIFQDRSGQVVKRFTVEHIDDFKSVCDLHGRGIFVTINSNYGLSDSLCSYDKFFA